jgi:pSer/pThr/pTyr-binding forkhead associated (FHA) protein
MTLSCIFEGQRKTYSFEGEEIVIGRTGARPDAQLRLDKDLHVSRRHARIYQQNGDIFVEDLGSRAGVYVNHARIEAPWEVQSGDMIRVGDTIICLEDPSASVLRDHNPGMETVHASVPPLLDTPDKETRFDEPTTGDVTIGKQIDVWHRALFFESDHGENTTKRQRLLYDLPVQFAAQIDAKSLFELILTRCIELVPGAERGALLSYESASGKLLLRASVPDEYPPLSRRLVKKAAAEGAGLVWSYRRNERLIQTGIYAPLVLHENVIGTICVDSPGLGQEFDEIDLKFVLAAAHYAAATLGMRDWFEG